MRNLNVLLEDELDAALRQLAERQDRPISRVVRSALEEYLSKYDDPGIGETVRTMKIEPIEDPVPGGGGQ